MEILEFNDISENKAIYEAILETTSKEFAATLDIKTVYNGIDKNGAMDTMDEEATRAIDKQM